MNKTKHTHIPELRFPEFKNDGAWEEKTLNNLAKYRRGSFPQPYGSPEWYDEVNGFPFVQVYDVDENLRLKAQTKNKISKVAAEQSVFIPKETIIITLQGSIGRVAITQYDAYVDRTLLLFEEFNKPIDKVFFAYTLQLLFNIEKQKAPGGIIKTITKEVLSDFIVNLPSLKEQQKIAACLSSLDELIEGHSQKLELLEEHKKGLLQNLFPQKGKKQPAYRFPKFKNDGDWEEKKVGEICNVFRGQSFSKSDITPEGSELCIHYGELFTLYNEVIYSIISKTNKVNGIRGEVGDILMPSSDVTPSGLAKASALEVENVILGGDINILRPKILINSIFLSYLINFSKQEILKYVSGTTVKHIYSSEIVKCKLILTSNPKEQQKIAACLSSLDELIKEQKQKIEQLKQHKRGLMQKLFVK
ncbi:restriction endonuclease subunit S [Riemerella columbina]|uniref:restriction endonuclease subunit S n=1 Tax=Riemerella columbina TaxID=103810 RepID=UPI00036927F4|nr:restriction endonuclease subunit S [Riemerella columbina]